MSYATHATKNSIIATVEKFGEATPKQIATALGSKWLSEPNHAALRKIIGSMTRGGFLRKVRYGVYAVGTNWECRKGFDGNDVLRRGIGDFLKEQGGIAETKAVHAAVGDYANLYQRRLVTEALRRDFSNDFGRGYWHLKSPEIAKLPLRGKWANLMSRQDGDSWKATRGDFFDSVGMAFMEARGDLTIPGLVSNPDIHAALRRMVEAAPDTKTKARKALAAKVQAELQAKGISERWLISKETRERFESELPIYVYAAFERGDVAAHLAAPIGFYMECARLFGVCPVKLSRGVVEVNE